MNSQTVNDSFRGDAGMGLKKGDIIEFTISDLVFGGKGLAKQDGMAVFVEKSVPPDRVMAQIVKKKKNFAEARLQSIIEPSPERIKAPCPYSGYCGGCKWQFLDYGAQLRYKEQHVADSLAHIGLLKNIPISPIIPSPDLFGYRNKMEFSCSDKKWLMPDEFETKEVEAGFALGLHVPGTFSKVIDIEACLLQPPLGNQIMADVRSFIKMSGISAHNLKTHEGFFRFLMLRHSSALNQWMVNFVTSDDRPDILRPLAEKLMSAYPEISSIVNNITARKSGVAFGEYEKALLGDAFILDRIGRFEFEISANSFFQTNTKGAEILYGVVKNFADLSGNERVLDLYSGTGTIPIFLSDAAEEIIGMEIVETAVDDARKNCLRNDVTNCRFIKGDARQEIVRLTENPDVIIIDPPRTGMHQDVVDQVVKIAPKRIVYVSCNPATLSRDLIELNRHYWVSAVQPVDMFPHTYHIECVVKLEKK